MNKNTSLRWHSLFDPNQVWGSLLLGAVGGMAGGVVGGLAGRASMRVVALLSGETPDFTIGGTFIVLLGGIIIGVLAGLVYGIVLPFLPGSMRWKGVFFGGMLSLALAVVVLFAEAEGETALLSKWAMIGLFATLPLLCSPITGLVVTWLIPQGETLKPESLPFARTAGALTLIFALTNMISAGILGATHPAFFAIGRDAALFLDKMAGGAFLLMIFTGLAGLLRSGATGKRGWVNAGLGFALTLVAFLGFGTFYEGMSAMELHGLVRLITRLDNNNATLVVVLLFGLAILGLIMAGIAVVRAGRWKGWQKYIPLFVGVFPLFGFIILYPPLLPAWLALNISEQAGLGHWVAVLFALCWFMLGLALRVEHKS